MATQVDGARRDVDVHQVVDDSTLDVANDLVHQVPAAHVHDLYVGQIPGAREAGQAADIQGRSSTPVIPCVLTCPEPRPEAGRTTRST